LYDAVPPIDARLSPWKRCHASVEALTSSVSLAFVAVLIGLRVRRDRGTDLGEVSSQWVMEHRMGPGGHDSGRWNQR
jgi:hypothetical protein